MTTDAAPQYRRPRPGRSSRDGSAPASYAPPANIQAEQSVLGAMLIERAAIDAAVQLISAQDFYRDTHAALFSAIVHLNENNTIVDAITIQEELSSRGKLEEIGGTAYLMALLDVIPSAANIEHYAKIVRDKAVLRRLIESSLETIALCRSEEPPDQIINSALGNLLDAAQDRGDSQNSSYKDILTATFEEVGRRTEVKHGDPDAIFGIPTGLVRLDYYTMGMGQHELIIVAARPGMGKTAAVVNFAEYAASKGHRVQIFSLEMTREQLGVRFLASGSRTDSTRMMRGEADSEDFERMSAFIAAHYSEADQLPIWVDDATGLTIGQIRARARRCQQQRGIDLVVVDYLQLATAEGSMQNRSVEVGKIAAGLKNLARELHIPVLCAAQLNRAADSRTDKRPMMSDLRESGGIENEADKILFLYREDYYDMTPASERYSETPEGQEHTLPAEIIIGKNRHGERGIIPVGWQPKLGRFVNVETHHSDRDAPADTSDIYAPGPPMAGQYQSAYDDEE